MGGALGCASAPPGREPVPLATQAAAPVPTGQDAAPAAAENRGPGDDADEALIATIQKGPYDPLEPVNRSFFALNRGIDYVLLDPITSAYEFRGSGRGPPCRPARLPESGLCADPRE